eukprot:TRINITY_DN1878_c0_g1_i3.p1 TRINITY_DN1878_c0_g1~~TRINITY_DN1878_c0_g1_i3.p1  ORF type:complete len:105 (+),score=23.57 TRINITY_DN1878_c0_g1_i3:43-357(+)
MAHQQQQVDLNGVSLWKRLSSTPLAAAGAAGTVGILGYGLYSFINQSNSGLSSARGMSLRVMMQGGTVAGLVAVFAYSGQGPFAPLHKKIREWRGESESSSSSH